MFAVRDAQAADVESAISVLGDAFAQDPLMLYLFSEFPTGVRAGTMAFFSMLLRARLALEMPACVVHQDGGLLGVAMGYDTSHPAWPAPLAAESSRFEAEIPGFVPRLAAYGAICDRYEPSEAHYYLGVIGIHPSLQGRGAGRALLDSFCARSLADTRSSGVYLDTTNAKSLQFYYANGFELQGEGRLDGTPVWCVYRRT